MRQVSPADVDHLRDAIHGRDDGRSEHVALHRDHGAQPGQQPPSVGAGLPGPEHAGEESQRMANKTAEYSATLLVAFPKNLALLKMTFPRLSTTKAAAAGPGFPLAPPSQ